jgi:hypothetical protein
LTKSPGLLTLCKPTPSALPLGGLFTKGSTMNNRELATVLAALRHWQHCDQSTMALVRHAWHKRNPNAPHPPDALDIACDCGAFLPLDPAEVSALCERLNATERLDPTADAGDGSGGPDPDLLEALQAFLRAPSIGSSGPGSVTIEVQTFNINNARAAIAKALGKSE